MAKSKAVTVSTKKLILELCEKYKTLPKKVTKELLAAFIDAIESSVVSGKRVRIDKLGILQVKDRAARMGRNPQTGEALKIPASKKVSFRAARALKERVGIKKKKATPVKGKAAPAKAAPAKAAAKGKK